MRVLSMLLIVTIILTGCASGTTDELPEPRMVYGLTLMPSGFDPHLNASSELGIPLRSVYDTLVYRDPATGQFVPGLAENWEVAPDGLSYTFTLKTGVIFHDGTPFNAEAVAANIERTIDPDNGSQKARFMLGPLTGYQTLDAYTISLTFSEPYAPLLDSLSQVYLGIASPTALENHDNATYQFHQVGTGPFRMVEYVPGDRLVITRNADYAWGPSFYTLASNPVQTIEFRFFEDPPTRALALESGEVQIMGEIQPVDAQLLSGNPALRIYPVPIPGQPLQFFINTAAFPTDNRAVRQALIFGTNRAAITETVFQRFSPIAYGPISPATDYYYDEVPSAYPYDVGQAQALLDAAGFTDINAEGFLIAPTSSTAPTPDPNTITELHTATPVDAEPTGVPLELTMIVPPWGLTPQVAQMIKSQWRELGINLEIRQVASFGQLLDAAASGEYNLISVNFSGKDPSVIDNFYLSQGVNNWTNYSDGDLDAFLREGTRNHDPDTRASLYASAQAHILDQGLVLPVRDVVNLNAAASNIEGVAFDAQGWFPLLHNFGIINESTP